MSHTTELVHARIESELNNFPFIMIDPATVLDEKEKWDKT